MRLIHPTALTWITREEGGFVPHPYRDSRGFWTIGIGHLITDKREAEALDDLEWKRVKEKGLYAKGTWHEITEQSKKMVVWSSLGLTITREYAEALLAQDLEAAQADLLRQWTTRLSKGTPELLDSLADNDPVRYWTLVMMVFQCGELGAKGWFLPDAVEAARTSVQVHELFHAGWSRVAYRVEHRIDPGHEGEPTALARQTPERAARYAAAFRTCQWPEE